MDVSTRLTESARFDSYQDNTHQTLFLAFLFFVSLSHTSKYWGSATSTAPRLRPREKKKGKLDQKKKKREDK